MRVYWAALALLVGIILIAVSINILRVPGNAPGDGGPNFVPIFQALCSLGGACLSFTIAWFLFKRPS